jgi:hypothetical protein
MGNLQYRWEGTVSSEAVLERVVASGRACQAAQGWRGRSNGYARLSLADASQHTDRGRANVQEVGGRQLTTPQDY